MEKTINQKLLSYIENQLSKGKEKDTVFRINLYKNEREHSFFYTVTIGNTSTLLRDKTLPYPFETYLTKKSKEYLKDFFIKYGGIDKYDLVTNFYRVYEIKKRNLILSVPITISKDFYKESPFDHSDKQRKNNLTPAEYQRKQCDEMKNDLLRRLSLYKKKKEKQQIDSSSIIEKFQVLQSKVISAMCDLTNSLNRPDDATLNRETTLKDIKELQYLYWSIKYNLKPTKGGYYFKTLTELTDLYNECEEVYKQYYRSSK